MSFELCNTCGLHFMPKNNSTQCDTCIKSVPYHLILTEVNGKIRAPFVFATCDTKEIAITQLNKLKKICKHPVHGRISTELPG